MDEIKNYADVLKVKRFPLPPNIKGVTWDVNTFENLIDVWTPREDILLILDTNRDTLDRFCKAVYKHNFNDTYNILTGITDVFMRRALKNQATMGNASATSIVTKHFMGLKDDEDKNANVNITFVSDLDK